MVTVKTDERRRVVLPGIEPGKVFAFTPNSDGTITLAPLKPVDEDVPVVKPVRNPDGTYRFPDGVKLTREQIRAAIRADRDRR